MASLRLKAAKLCWALARRGPRRALLLQRVLASSEHRRIAFRRSYGTVIDIGAHRGQFSVFAAHSFPHARLYCFEPQPQALARLRKVAASLSVELEIFPYAAGSKPEKTDMHISARDDSSSLLPIAELGQAAAFPGTQEVGLTSVEVQPLDHLLTRTDFNPPVLMKIDVQGGELAVLHGAERTLEHVDDILVECSFRELYENQPLASAVLLQLFQRSFELADVHIGAKDGHGPIQADVLLRRSSFSSPG